MRERGTYQAATADVDAPERGPLGLLAIAIAVTTALRLALVHIAPDLDTDAYGHAVIGRKLLEPHDFTVHWVWLPFWHWVHAVIARLDVPFDALRALSALTIGGLIALVFTSTRRDHGALVAAFAGVFVALTPLLATAGSSSQSEALFALLVFATCVSWHRDGPIFAGVLAAIACLLRYEAWVFPIILGSLAIVEKRPPRAHVAALFPLAAMAAIFAWRLEAGEGLLSFRAENHAFVADAIAHIGYPWGPSPSPWRMAIWYPVSLPWYELRWTALFALVGLPTWLRRAPLAHRVTALGLLAFVSASFVRGDNLGLERHFVVLVPFYAISAAIGLIWLSRRASEWLASKGKRVGVSTIAIVLTLALTGPHSFWMDRAFYRRSQIELVSERSAADAVARALRWRARLYCPVPAIEILSGAPAGIARRGPLADVTDAMITADSSAFDVVVIAGPSADVARFRRTTRSLFDDGRFAVVSVDRDAAALLR